MAYILVIDDDNSSRVLFKQFLESKGYEVGLATNGSEGLQKIKTKKPDLVITDIMMPVMDGLEVLMQIRQQHLELPVIAMSGGMRDAPVNFLAHAKKFGACRVFEKPIVLSDLLVAVQELLQKPTL